MKHSDQPASAPQVGVLATGSNDMMVRLWNPVVTTRPTSVLGGHKVKHTRPSLCFSTPVDIPLYTSVNIIYTYRYTSIDIIYSI